jgi:hypothetical protein
VAGQPDPKSRTLARGERRYRRKVASPKQWQAIIAAKGSSCRLVHAGFVLATYGPVQYHHLVPRDMGGDDVADNIVPLCPTDHELITRGNATALYRLGERLTDAEYAYIVGRLGEDGPARLFGVGAR